jgi:outer membrane biosynthesis protein TonB
MSFILVRSAAGLALLAALTAGCSTAVAAHSSVPKPTATAHSVKPSAKPSVKPSVKPPAPPTTPPPAPPTTPPPAPPTTPPPAPPTTQPPAPPATMPAPPPNPIQQGDGGDHDPDNNGGPSDGDGNI